MHFGRRKSGLAVESAQSDTEPRRRNRLSKPPTSNGTKIQTSTSSSALSLQVPTQSQNASTTDLTSKSPLSPISGNELRQQIRAQVLGPESDNPLSVPAKKKESTFSVAYLVNQIEGKSPTIEEPPKQLLPQEPVSAVPARPQKRKSSLLRRLSLQRSSSLIRTTSSEQISSPMTEAFLTSTPNASVDRVVDSPAIPSTRRSSFTPGAATRKLAPMSSNQDMDDRQVIEEVEEPAPSIVESEYFDWEPPPPRTSGRAGTPSDMGYSQLGGLRHGSLQIVNGRASPALSEASKVSKQVLMVPASHRDVSSEYGETDDDLDPSVIPSRTGTLQIPTERRFFSWEQGDDRAAPRSHPLQNVINRPEATDFGSQNQTSDLANEYIAELGVGPFEPERSHSPVGTIRRTRSEGSLWRASSYSSLHSSRTLQKDFESVSPVSPMEHSPSPTGSVVRKISIETARSRALLHLNTDSDTRQLESAMSWYSPVDPSIPVDEAFQSAVEFQVQPTPSRKGLHPPRAAEKSDSGYSSSNSLRSVQLTKRTPPSTDADAQTESSNSATTTSTPRSSRPPSLLGQRPSILKSRKTEPSFPSFGLLSPSFASSTSKQAKPVVSATSSEADTSNATNPRKKLVKKRRPLGQPRQISVVRVQSFEHDSIPQVPVEAQENLRIRSQAVPELEQTLALPRARGARPESSVLDLSNTEIRFPSPAPEETLQTKRSRSRSRPRTWFGRGKTDASSSRCNSGISQADAVAIINNFGTDGAVLGRNPYDFSEQTPSRTPYTRSVMDDETAASLSRRRSRTIQEGDSMLPERRPSFNDRGGIPGKKLRPASLFGDAPPPITQAMLAKARRTSSMQRQPSESIDSPPPPPPHASRPSYLDNGRENDLEAVAPPPPSHSPRPVDITPDPWAAQAGEWRARRKSAGEVLRRQPDFSQSLSPEQFSSSPREYYNHYDTSPSQQAYYSSYETSFDQRYENQPAHPTRSSRKSSMSYDLPTQSVSQSREPSRHRPLPVPRASAGGVPSRPQSHVNNMRNFGVARAVEKLHTPYRERAHPPTAFGRYSGAGGYGYDRATASVPYRA